MDVFSEGASSFRGVEKPHGPKYPETSQLNRLPEPKKVPIKMGQQIDGW